MALLQDLIDQIEDTALRERILKETDKLVKQKKFGLVFEDHLPEQTLLYDIPICVGSIAALKSGKRRNTYRVISIDGDKAVCEREETKEQSVFNISDLVAAAHFGKPIYPALQLLDMVENAPDSGLWHP